MKESLFELHARVEEAHWWFSARRTIMRQLVERLVPVGTGAVVVDVGCGTGANLDALAHDYRCVGIDGSRLAVELARQRFPAVQFIHGSAPADLGSIARQARMFLLMDVLEHVDDDFALLSSLIAESSPGAHFLVTVPADPELWSQHDVSFGHFRRYDRGRFTRLWEDLPVTTRLVSHFNSRLYPLIRGIRALNRFRGRASGECESDLKLPSTPVNGVLQRVFAGEGRALLAGLDGAGRGYSRGVSLLAVLRREEGTAAPRSKPNDVAPDLFQPNAGVGER